MLSELAYFPKGTFAIRIKTDFSYYQPFIKLGDIENVYKEIAYIERVLWQGIYAVKEIYVELIPAPYVERPELVERTGLNIKDTETLTKEIESMLREALAYFLWGASENKDMKKKIDQELEKLLIKNI